MIKYPALDDYSDDELILLVYAECKDWQPQAIDYAKNLLKVKGITEYTAKTRLKVLEKEAVECLKKEIDDRKTESYHVIDLIFMMMFWPKYILTEWHLSDNGYILKRKQRLMCLSLGFSIYLLVAVYNISTFDSRQQAKIAKANQQAQIDSISQSKIDWTGNYIFTDTIKNQSSKFRWKLSIQKVNNNHTAKLQLIHAQDTISVSCTGFIKNKGLELYPDKSYSLFNGIEIEYYDNLFTLFRQKGEIITCWKRLKPYNSLKNNQTEIFEKENFSNVHIKASHQQ